MSAEMRELRDAPYDPIAPLFSYRARYGHLSRLNYLGLGVAYWMRAVLTG